MAASTSSFSLDPSFSRKRRILFVASECVPFAKSGGLGDVVAGLAKALTRKGHDVRIVIPRYYSVDKARSG